ncbi:MAG TPA: hypothetical protein VGU20_01680 [Stellaceae bacterium]|nr:hypothetical protein [Stellaceae bacterium]
MDAALSVWARRRQSQCWSHAVKSARREALRRRGYIDISNPAVQPDGSWTEEAPKEFNGRKVTVIVDRYGGVAERPLPTQSAR